MIIKINVTNEPKIYFGTIEHLYDLHNKIAEKYHISLKKVRGGGLANLETKQIFGSSISFGKYNPNTVRALLPNWDIDE